MSNETKNTVIAFVIGSVIVLFAFTFASGDGIIPHPSGQAVLIVGEVCTMNNGYATQEIGAWCMDMNDDFHATRGIVQPDCEDSFYGDSMGLYVFPCTRLGMINAINEYNK